jgi:glycosyltransferase involved in cell wall biosynthesis
MNNPRPKTLSLVIPAYNEEHSLPRLRAALENWLPLQPWTTEAIIIDDGSTDGTNLFLHQWAAEAAWLKVIRLSRNFGHQAALTAGLDHATGEVTVILDADLQDPLEVIPEMVAKYCEGFDVVYGQRTKRQGESGLKRATAWLFYRLMQKLACQNLPPDTGDFRLVSQRCLQTVRSMRETHRFLRGMFSWVGFEQTACPYVRQERSAGQTKYSYRKMFQFACDAIFSFSPFPLRVALIQGILVAGFGLVYGLYSVLRWALVGDTVTGWPSLVVLLCVIGGSILVALGLVGEYISRIYEELKKRPLYIISRKLNINEPDPHQGSLLP